MVFGDIFVRENIRREFEDILRNPSLGGTFTFSSAITAPNEVYKNYRNATVYILDRAAAEIYKYTTSGTWTTSGASLAGTESITTPRPEAAIIDWSGNYFYQSIDATASEASRVRRYDISNGDITAGKNNPKTWNLVGGFSSITNAASGLDYFRDPADGEDKLFVLDQDGLLQVINVETPVVDNYEQEINIKTAVSGWSPSGDLTSCRVLFGGKKFLVASRGDNTIWEMDFGTPYDLSTLTYSGSKLNLGTSIIDELTGVWVYWRDPYKSGIWVCGADVSKNKVAHITLSGDKYVTPVP